MSKSTLTHLSKNQDPFMKRYALLFVCLLTIVTLDATELARFSASNYQGWIYTRDDISFENNNINSNRITLYGDYTLISPMIDATGVDNIIVKVTGKSLYINSPDYAYNPTLGSPTVELLDINNNVLDSQTFHFTTAEFDRYFELIFNISSLANKNFKLRLACWDSDFASTMAVRKVIVEDYAIDVDGDGNITVGDITALYNYLINGDSSAIVNGDVDGDGSITAGDVTVIYNYLLGMSNQ